MDASAPTDNVFVVESIDELYAKCAFLEKAVRVLINDNRALQSQIDALRGYTED